MNNELNISDIETNNEKKMDFESQTHSVCTS